MEDALRNQSQLLTGILENLPVSVLRMNAEGRFSEVNGAGLRAAGLEEWNLVGQNALERFPEVAGHIQEALDGGSAHFP